MTHLLRCTCLFVHFAVVLFLKRLVCVDEKLVLVIVVTIVSLVYVKQLCFHVLLMSDP